MGKREKATEAGRLVDGKKQTPDIANAELAEAAKTIVALAFRNGPLEVLHAGMPCPTCHGDSR